MTQQTTAEWTMWGTIGTGVFTLLLAVFALLAWLSSRKTLEQMKTEAKNAEDAQDRQLELMQRDFDARQEANTATLEHLRADSAAQTRPYVHARLERSMGANQGTDLIISNVGRSTARDLCMEIDRWPSREDDLTKALRKMMDWQRDLPPGTQLRTFWDMDATKTKTDGNLGIQEPVVMRLTYRGDDKTMPEFEDEYPLDMSINGMTPLGWEGSKASNQGPVANRLNDVVRALSELRRNQ